MRKLSIFILGLLILVSCASVTEISKPADITPETLPESSTEVTVAVENIPDETAGTAENKTEDAAAELEEIAERCEQKSIDLLKERMYQITENSVSQVVRYGDVKEQCTIPEKLVYYSEVVDDTLFLLVTVPTDMGDILLLYNAGGMMMLDNPPTVDRPVPTLPVENYSIPASPSFPATVHGIREFQLSYDERAPLLIRITSRQELEEICPMIVEFSDDNIDYTHEYTDKYDPDGVIGWMNLTECYDAAWFETHDLWIAVKDGGSSTPRLYAEVNGNSLSITYEHCEIMSDDIIGRQILVEVNKGDILTWERTDGRYHTVQTYSTQKAQWLIEDCYDTCVRMIKRNYSFVTALPEYHWTVFNEIPEKYLSENFIEGAEQLNIGADSPILQMDLTANDGTYTVFFTENGRYITLYKN